MTSPQDLLFPYDEKIDLSKNNIKLIQTVQPRTSLKLDDLVDLSKLKDQHEIQSNNSASVETCNH